jgi:hypothetical protein
MRKSAQSLVIASLSLIFFAAAQATNVTQVKTAGAYRIELHVLPAEPFFTKEEVAAKQVKDGMEIEGGATPVALGADSHPNHHLIVHVFDQQSGKAVTDATVTMSAVPVDAKGKPIGTPIDVPVVVMQAIGHGPASTHYGNNVTMPPGHYSVAVTVNGQKAIFAVTVSDVASAPMDHMGHMKM